MEGAGGSEGERKGECLPLLPSHRPPAAPSAHSGGSHIAGRAKWAPCSTRRLYNWRMASASSHSAVCLSRPPFPFPSSLPSSLTRGRVRCAVSKHRQLKREERADDAAASARLHKYMFVRVIEGERHLGQNGLLSPGTCFCISVSLLRRLARVSPAGGRQKRNGKKKACASSRSHQVGTYQYFCSAAVEPTQCVGTRCLQMVRRVWKYDARKAEMIRVHVLQETLFQSQSLVKLNQASQTDAAAKVIMCFEYESCGI